MKVRVSTLSLVAQYLSKTEKSKHFYGSSFIRSLAKIVPADTQMSMVSHFIKKLNFYECEIIFRYDRETYIAPVKIPRGHLINLVPSARNRKQYTLQRDEVLAILNSSKARIESGCLILAPISAKS